jgi:hypothetical protein
VPPPISLIFANELLGLKAVGHPFIVKRKLPGSPWRAAFWHLRLRLSCKVRISTAGMCMIGIYRTIAKTSSGGVSHVRIIIKLDTSSSHMLDVDRGKEGQN